MATITYAIAKGLLNTVDWTGAGKFRLLLATSTYVPSAAHQHVSDVTNEATGVGYARKLLGTRTRATVGSNVQYKAAKATWLAITSAFRYAIVYYDVAGDDSTDATAWLVCALDLGDDKSLAGIDYSLVFGGADPGPVFVVE